MRRSIAILLFGLISAALAVPSAAAAPQELLYAGTRTGPAPTGLPPTTPATLRFICEDGVCVREDADHSAWRITIVDGVGRNSGSEPESGDPCTDDFLEGVTWDITIDAQRLNAVMNFTSEYDKKCPAPAGQTRRVSARPFSVTYEGELVSGECVFQAGGCEASNSPSNAPSGTPPQASATPAPGPASPGSPAGPPGTSSRLGTGDPAARSVVSGLIPPQELSVEPPQLLLAVALTIILVLLVAFPTALLNSATESGSDRFSAWWRGRGKATAHTPAVEADGTAPDAVAVDPPTGPAEPEAQPGSRRGWWWAAGGVAVAGLISCFVDPQFGFNPGSLRLLASVLVGFAVDVALGWLVTIWLVRRIIPGATHDYVFKPVSLVVVVAAVVLTRVTGFEPGIVFGLVAGVAFGAVAAGAAHGKAALAQLGYAFGAAVLAWLAYGALSSQMASGDDFWSTFLLETLGSIAIGGMAALPIALFPVRGLAGQAIWEWNRWIWAGAYAVGLFAFFVVLMPMPFSWQQVQLSLVAWLTIYLAYLGAAVVLWLVLARPLRGGVGLEAGKERVG